MSDGGSATLPGDATTFVCCIESGRLEEQTILMLRSLRRFGGVLAAMPVIAVVGRSGPPLRPATAAELRRLNVQLVKAKPDDNPATWLNYANKVAAVMVAERLATTPTVTWLDSDMLVPGEPLGVLLRDGEDLVASCDPLPPSILDGDPAHVPYWRTICELLDARHEDFPWVAVEPKRFRQQINFSSGVFTWRRGSGFAEKYKRDFTRLLQSRVAQHNGMFFTADQVILAPMVVRDGLRWRHLEWTDHLIVLPGQIGPGPMQAADFGKANIIHYSGSLNPPTRAAFLERLRAEHPEFARFFDAQSETLDLGPIPSVHRLQARALRAVRGLRYRLFDRRTRKAPLGT